ncbi:MAG: hypothetical protein H8E55_28610 [Pelagibacterales bacterium]|nr:hypothetical protein [Pelagibacterales bacterium]
MAICIGVTGVASILLWFYFKTRIESVEGKLDNMFNMIQSFSEQAPTLPKDNSPYFNEQEMAEAPYENPVVSQQLPTEMFEKVVENIINNNNTELIDVSDDSGEDSESDDESDDESEEEEVMLEVEIPKPTEEIPPVEEKKLFQAEDSLDDIDTDESDDESDDESNDENDKKNLELKEEVKEYPEMKVSELKKLASDKGLTGYTKLNKAGLVNLLENN